MGIRVGVSINALKNDLALSRKRKATGCMGYPKKRLAFLVSDKRKEGCGGNRTAEKKKAGRLQVQPITLDIVGTHVPCLVYAHVYAGV